MSGDPEQDYCDRGSFEARRTGIEGFEPAREAIRIEIPIAAKGATRVGGLKADLNQVRHRTSGAKTSGAQHRHPRPRSYCMNARPQGAALDRCRRKFRHYFRGAFRDETYLAWERDYKWQAHLRWQEELSAPVLLRLARSDPSEVARRAVRIESRTNLLFSFEKMALRDAVRSSAGAARFAKALQAFLRDDGPTEDGFDAWCRELARLPRRQTRVLTWPLATVFGFIAQPRQHMFLKPRVTQVALRRCACSFEYSSRPSGKTYVDYLKLGATLRRELVDFQPRDLIDIQSFLWVQGSDEYP